MYSHLDILNSNSIGEYKWAYPFIGASLIILSIHFSPELRHIFSHPYPVFLGSISFPLYLTHSFLMRSVLVWIVFGILPSSEEQWLISTALKLVVFPLWFAGVIYICIIWNSRLDSWTGWFAQWSEEVMLGKRQSWEMIGNGIGSKVIAKKEMNGNGHDADLKFSEKDKYIV